MAPSDSTAAPWRLDTLLLNSPSLVVYATDVEGRYSFASQGLCTLLGCSHPAQVLGRSAADFAALGEAPGRLRLSRFDGGRRAAVHELIEVLPSPGRETCVLLDIQLPLLDGSGRLIGVAGIAVDVSEDMRSTDSVIAQNRLLDTVLSHVDAHVFQKDDRGRYLYVNRRVADLYGRPVHEILGRTDLELLPGELAETLMATDRQVLKDNERLARQESITDTEGRVHHFWSIKAPLRLPGQAPSVIGFASEITELLALQESLLRQRTTDELTGLSNRLRFEACLIEAIEQARRQDTGLAVMLIDVDHFRFINSTHGPILGDQVLRDIGARLSHSPLLRDMQLARLAGNRFAVLLPDIDASQAARHAQALRELIAIPLAVQAQRLRLTASIGISLYPADATGAQDLITHAEVAMYRAKESGRDQHCFYSHQIGAAVAERARLEAELREAVATDSFELHYQPKVEVASGRVTGVEALLRWPRPGRESISPAVFVPLAERLGLVVAMGAWVIDQACGQLASWQAGGLADIAIAVNLSPGQLRDRALPPLVLDRLQHHGVPPERLEMEVTESLLMDNSEHAISVLQELRDLGISLAIDDFGTGYSSLSYLKRLPVQTLKLDKSFITKIGSDEREADLCAGIVGLSHKLGLTVVAEGVEDAVQVELLRAMHCEVIQGFYFSRPLPAEEVERFIRRQNG